MRAVHFGGIYIPFLERSDERPVTKHDWQRAETVLRQECHNKHYFHNRPGGVPFWLEDDAMGADATQYQPQFEHLNKQMDKIRHDGSLKSLFSNLFVFMTRNPLGKMELLETQLLNKAHYLKMTIEEDIHGKLALIRRIF